MKTNPILKEIRRIRDQLYDEAGGDLRKLFEMARQKEIASAKRGEIIIAAPSRSTVVREDLPEYSTQSEKETTS